MVCNAGRAVVIRSSTCVLTYLASSITFESDRGFLQFGNSEDFFLGSVV